MFHQYPSSGLGGILLTDQWGGLTADAEVLNEDLKQFISGPSMCWG